jgi:hypothetical protein
MKSFKLLPTLVLLLVTASLSAQTTKEAFVSLPENLSPDLGPYARMDLIDLYQSGLPAAIPNSFGDTIRMESFTPNALKISSGAASLQLVVLNLINDSQLYLLIHTVCGPVCDSHLSFYSPAWNRLQPDPFIAPADPFFFLTGNAPHPPPSLPLMQWDYDTETSVLRQTYTAPQSLSADDRARLQPHLAVPAKEYRWNGLRFE